MPQRPFPSMPRQQCTWLEFGRACALRPSEQHRAMLVIRPAHAVNWRCGCGHMLSSRLLHRNGSVERSPVTGYSHIRQICPGAAIVHACARIGAGTWRLGELRSAPPPPVPEVHDSLRGRWRHDAATGRYAILCRRVKVNRVVTVSPSTPSCITDVFRRLVVYLCQLRQFTSSFLLCSE